MAIQSHDLNHMEKLGADNFSKSHWPEIKEIWSDLNSDTERKKVFVSFYAVCVYFQFQLYFVKLCSECGLKMLQKVKLS